MRNHTKYLFFTLFLFYSLVSFGQGEAMLKQFLTVKNGLSHNEVTAIVQDHDGFIWIGTRGGLNRYDGYEMKVFNQEPENENSLVNPSIQTLFIDSKGNLWIGTMSGGISKYNPKTGSFKNIINNYNKKDEVVPANHVLTFYEAKDGKMWIGTWSSGLYVYDENKDEAKQYLDGSRVSVIAGTADNRIFVGSTISGGLFEYKKEDDSFVQLSDRRCRRILYDEPRNVLWFVGGDNIGAGSSKKGLLKLDLSNNKISEYGINSSGYNSENLPHSYYSLLLDTKGKIWLGTWGTGLYVFNPDEESFERHFIYPQKGRIHNKDYDAILEIFEDKQNNIWLGTNGGGVCILSQKLGFNSVGYSNQASEGLLNTRVMSVLEDKKENLWIGTIGNGLFWSPNRKDYYPVNTPGLGNEDRFFVIKYIFEDNAGTVWVGTNLGTHIIEFKNGFPQLSDAYLKYGKEALKTTAVSFLNAHGMFWHGSLKKGLFLLDKKDYSLKKHLNTNMKNSGNMNSNRISCMLKDSKDRIWLGTYNGLHVHNLADTTINIAEDYYKINGKLTGNIITCIEEDKKGNIWIGTPNGLNRMTQTSENEFEISYFTEEDGLVSNFIKGIACDMKGDIWFSTNTGISKYISSENRFINFDESDGVLGRNFTEASVCENAKGELFFGGTQGLTYFNPEEIIENQLTSIPVFTELKVSNETVEVGREYQSKIILEKSFSQTEKIELSYQQNKLEIGFSALDFVSHGSNNYEFILEDSDTEWNKIGTRPFIIFTDLAPGEYVLKVRSSNSHNFWSDEVAELTIIIHPPFWRTWYALLFYLLLVTGIVIVIRRNAMRQVHLRNSLEIETLQHEQDQKLNELKLRFFTNISHEFRTPLTLILAPLKEIIRKKEKYEMNDELYHKIGIAQNNSQRLMNMVNQLLEFRKVETDNMKLVASFENIEDFVMEICSPFYELAGINNIEFTTESKLNTKEVWFDSDKLEIILNNLVSNAFKFSQNDAIVKVIISEDEGNVYINVSDNGMGIPANEIENIFDRYYRVNQQENSGGSGIGLALSKRLVELHKGTLSVSSESNVHTEFSLSLLKGNEHLLPNEMIQKEKSTFLKKENPFLTIVPKKVESEKELEHCVLIVEDTLDVRTYLFSLLAPLYRVNSVADGKEAIKMAKKCKPDLILSDVIMPNMDGIELCKKIRSNPSSADIPFIFLTAKNDEQTQLLSAQIGANDIISKPFDPNLLLEKVASTLKRYKNLQLKFSKSVWLEPSNIEITSGDDAFLSKAILVIENNLQNDDFSANVLASELNKSYSSLYRKLKKLTGASISDFIRSIRIKRAAQLIVDKEKTISEIAFEVGFNDLKYFRKVFQKEFDCSPSEYRKKV